MIELLLVCLVVFIVFLILSNKNKSSPPSPIVSEARDIAMNEYGISNAEFDLIVKKYSPVLVSAAFKLKANPDFHGRKASEIFAIVVNSIHQKDI